MHNRASIEYDDRQAIGTIRNKVSSVSASAAVFPLRQRSILGKRTATPER